MVILVLFGFCEELGTYLIFVNGQPTPEYPNPVLAVQMPAQTRPEQGGCRKPPTKRYRLLPCDYKCHVLFCYVTHLMKNVLNLFSTIHIKVIQQIVVQMQIQFARCLHLQHH